MTTKTRIRAWFERSIVAASRNRLWVELQSLDQDSLTKAGFAPELLKKGPHAWPWRYQSDGCCSGNVLTDDHQLQVSHESRVGLNRDGPIVDPI